MLVMLKKRWRTDLAPSTLENDANDGPKTDHESAFSPPAVFVRMVIGNTPQILSTPSQMRWITIVVEGVLCNFFLYRVKYDDEGGLYHRLGW